MCRRKMARNLREAHEAMTCTVLWASREVPRHLLRTVRIPSSSIATRIDFPHSNANASLASQRSTLIHQERRAHLPSLYNVCLHAPARPRIRPNYGFLRQLDVFAECDYAPSPEVPAYLSWKRRHKQEMTAFLSKIVDTTGIIPDQLYLSECVVPTLRLYHLLTMIHRLS